MDFEKAKLDELNQQVEMGFAKANLSTPTSWGMVADEVPSSTKKNVFPWMSKLPSFRLFNGETVAENVASRDYSLLNQPYRLDFDLSIDDWKDDTIGLFPQVIADAGRVRAEFPDLNVFKTLEAGTANLCWDGQFFFDVDHPVNIDDPASPIYSNLFIGTVGGFAYDWVVDPVNTFAKVRANMMKLKRDDGTSIGLVPNVLVGGPDMEGPILKAIEATFVTDIVRNSGTPVAAAGITNVYYGKAIGIITPWVTSATRVYALCTTRGIKPLLYQLRDDTGLIADMDLASPAVKATRRFSWYEDVRAAFGYGLPQMAICSGSA